MTKTEEPVPSAQHVEMDQEKDASDVAAVLQDELIQAADRERQLQILSDKMKDDVGQLQKQLERQSNLQEEFDDFKRRSAPLWEREMKRHESRFSDFSVFRRTLLLYVRLMG